MIKVHIFHTGAVRVDDAIPHGSKNPLAVTGIFRGKDKNCLGIFANHAPEIKEQVIEL